MPPLKTCMMAVCCGGALFVAVSAHAKIATNGVNLNGISLNKLAVNGISLNKLATNKLSANRLAANGNNLNGASVNGHNLNGAPLLHGTPTEAQNEGLAFNGLSQKPLGKR